MEGLGRSRSRRLLTGIRYDLVSREQMSMLVTQGPAFCTWRAVCISLGASLSQDWSADSSSPLGRILMHLATCWWAGALGPTWWAPPRKPLWNQWMHSRARVSRGSLMMWMWAHQFLTLMMRSPAVTALTAATASILLQLPASHVSEPLPPSLHPSPPSIGALCSSHDSFCPAWGFVLSHNLSHC